MASSEANQDEKSERPPSKAPSVKSERPPSKAPSVKSERPPSKAPSVKSERPPSKTPSVKPEREPSKAASVKSERPPSKAPSVKSERPPSKAASVKPEREPSNAPSVRSERPPSKAPSAVSRASKGQPPQSGQSRRSHHSVPPLPPEERSLQSSGHPFPRRNTHLGHKPPSRQSVPDPGPRSQSLPPQPPPTGPKRRPSAASLGPPLAAGTPLPGQTTPRGSAILDPLPMGSHATLAKGPSMGSMTSIRDPDKLMGSQRFLNAAVDDPENPRPDRQLPREKYFGSMTSLKTIKDVKPLPKIKELKEPKHPRNKYILKKLDELEALNKKLREGPWDGDDLRPKKQDIIIEGPYSLDDVKYSEDDLPVRLVTTPEPGNIIEEIRFKFQLPPAFDPETGQIKEEIARAAAIMASVTADPRESKLNPDPTQPAVCDCCEDMNDHNRHLADLEREHPRPRVVQARQLLEELGQVGQEAHGYYRSDSPVLIPVSTYMERDLASEEMIKVGLPKDTVNTLKHLSKPRSVPFDQVPWPFYAHDLTSTADLTTYLDTGMPLITDALMTVNVGEANSKYKDSMDRLARVMRKF